MRTCMIFNPKAGTADRMKDILLRLPDRHDCELCETTPDCGAGKLARSAVERGIERLIIAGGDGSINEAVNGIAPHFEALQLAVLPFGTGNDLARSLGVAVDDLHAACDIAFGRNVRDIDVVRMTSDGEAGWFVNVANGGLGGQVAADIRGEDKQRWGAAAYWMTSVSDLMDLREYHVRMEVDGREHDFRSVGLAVANGRYVGGGFPISPQARLDDGLLNVTVVPVLSSMELLAAGMNLYLGGDEGDDRIRHYQAKALHLTSEPDMPFSIDGELYRPFDASFEVIPNALRIATGVHAEGLSE